MMRSVATPRRARTLCVVLLTVAALVGAASLLAQAQESGNTTIVAVGDRRINLREATERLARLVVDGELVAGDVPGRQEAATRWLRSELLIVAAKEAGFGDHPEVVRYNNEVLVQTLLQQHRESKVDAAAVAQEAERRYREERDRYLIPELRRAHYIRISKREDADALLLALRDQGLKAFRESAQKQSEDQETRLRGGDLRYFDREGRVYVWHEGKMAPTDNERRIHEDLVAAAFNLETHGEMPGEPLPIEAHWALLMLTGQRPGRTRSLEEARATLTQAIVRERRQEAYDTLISALKKRYKPQSFPERIAPIRL